MNNHFLAQQTEQDIDRRVARILKDIGDPDPPLSLEVVRELLRLDLKHYSINDPSIVRETVHKLKVAGKQIFARPGLLLDAIRKHNLKALYIPDRRRILIDSDLPLKKQRWGEAHEIGHDLCPWHKIVMHGDHAQTLSPTSELQIEAEANYAAGRLLFMQNRFRDHLGSPPLTIASVRGVAKIFGNSITSTLWRSVECSDSIVFGMVSQHPLEEQIPEPIRYFIRSKQFARQFSGVNPSKVMNILPRFCRNGRGPLGQDTVLFCDCNGDDHEFTVECFFNGWEALTLGIHKAKRQVLLFG